MKPFVTINGMSTAFVTWGWDDEEITFPPTVAGARELWAYCIEHYGEDEWETSMNLSYPEEYELFEPHAIDIAAGRRP